MSETRRRWSVVEVDLGHPTGHEQGSRRPALVVSNEPFNRMSGLLTVLPITSVKAARSPQPFEVLLPAAPLAIRSTPSSCLTRCGRFPRTGLTASSAG